MLNRQNKTVVLLLALSILLMQTTVPAADNQNIYMNDPVCLAAEIEPSATDGSLDIADTTLTLEEAPQPTDTDSIRCADASDDEPGEVEAPQPTDADSIRCADAPVDEAGEVEAPLPALDESEAEDPPMEDYARDEERFGRYYEALTGFDVPSAEQAPAVERAEEITGAAVPSSYRTRRLTPVRDQGTSNLCWVFSTTALLEASLLMRYSGVNASTLDLSEEQLAYFYFNRQNDPLGNTGDMKMVYNSSLGKTAYRYASGTPVYLLQELSTGQGVTTEQEVPFYLKRISKADGTVYYEESNVLPAARSAYLSYANISSYKLFDYDVDKVKKEIMENGAVSVAMYYENWNRNLSTNAYYSSANKRSNHVVTLVGWNDTYARSKFNSSERPKHDGAWIVKNSWGDDWGDGGYFYLSYENATLLGCVSAKAILTSKKNYKNLYFYDGLSMVGNSCCIKPLSAGKDAAVTAGANVYEVKAGKGRGEAIGEVVLCSWTGNAKYRVSIYTDLVDTDNPVSGRRALVFTAQMADSGLCTFPLSKEVNVSAGSWYSVVVENVGSKTESYSAQRNQLINDVYYVTDNLFCRSLTRNRKGKWTDMAEDGDGEVLRIRAATKTLGKAVKPRKVFTDVLDPEHAYYNAIYWAADRGIAGGYNDGTFGINKPCTRGEAIMFLWRFAGKPEPAGSPKIKFSDISVSDPFYKAILWAYQKGITRGYGDGTFGRNRICTRGHIMMFLWRYLGMPAPKAAASSPFSDVPKSHSYYKAILYGAQKGITKGFKDGTFGVNKSCTRGQIVKFLYNMR